MNVSAELSNYEIIDKSHYWEVIPAEGSGFDKEEEDGPLYSVSI